MVTGVLSGIVDVPLSSDIGTGELSIIQWSLLLENTCFLGVMADLGMKSWVVVDKDCAATL